MKNLIEIKNVSKIYKLYNKNTDRIKEAFTNKKLHKEYYALNNVTFSVKKGETIGIIGKNGAGKSTILKIITGVLKPTTGEIKINGKIAALLELGTGFNPEFTGIENIYLNGRIMGFTKDEIKEKINSIIEFADIGEFINQPVKTYSSGMFARLAFSVAISVEPEILIVDEALSVGDMQFQEKSITKMKEIRDKGTTIIYVSHSLASVRNFCERAIWFKNGEITKDGESSIICEKYEEFLKQEREAELLGSKNRDTRSLSIVIEDVFLNQDNYFMDSDIEILIKLKFIKNIEKYSVGILIHDERGKLVTLFNTVRDDIEINKKMDLFKLKIPNNDFISGKYYVSVAVNDEKVMFHYDRVNYIKSFIIKPKKNHMGIPIAEGNFRAKHEWIIENKK